MARETNPADKARIAITQAKAAITAAETALARQECPVVLVIDDSDDSRDLYAEFLTVNGYRVVTAADGPDGLQQARETKPDVIVLDLGLPIVDGWEVTRLLRADPETRGVCIIACSGFAGDGDQQRAFDAGVDLYLVKPCSPEVLQGGNGEAPQGGRRTEPKRLRRRLTGRTSA